MTSQPTPSIQYTDPAQTLAIGRAMAILKMPYFGSLFRRISMVAVPGLGTAGMTDRGLMIYDPEKILVWANRDGITSVAGVIVHEALHWLLGHGGRRGTRDPKMWNIAADLYINGQIRAAEGGSGPGLSLPKGGVWPEQYTTVDGQPFPETATADAYFDLLAAGATSNGGGDGDVAAGQCGSGAGGEPLPGEPADGSDQGEISDSEREALTDRVRRETAEHAEKHGAGSVPLGMDRWVSQARKPRVAPWPDRVRHATETWLNKLGRGRRVYSRPARRTACMQASGIRDVPVLPVRADRKVALWLVIDTSGSMSERQLELGVGLVQSQCERRGVAVSVFSCDADVSGPPTRVKSWQDAASAIKGGGGTDFRPIFALYDRTPPKERPQVIQVWTDGDGPAPELAPQGVVVQWILSCPYGEPRPPASWGDVVTISREELGA